jgi:TRAP-type mannitol/chloroaromatic compound transport system permease large subunit
MGIMLEKTKIAAGLYNQLVSFLDLLKEDLGIGVVIVGMLLAASTGIVGATVVTMGMLSLPSMMKAGYDQKIATGTICAAGTLRSNNTSFNCLGFISYNPYRVLMKRPPCLLES